MQPSYILECHQIQQLFINSCFNENRCYRKSCISSWNHKEFLHKKLNTVRQYLVTIITRGYHLVTMVTMPVHCTVDIICCILVPLLPADVNDLDGYVVRQGWERAGAKVIYLAGYHGYYIYLVTQLFSCNVIRWWNRAI